jgi:hypothetical protein
VEINQVIREVLALTCSEASENPVSVQTRLAESVSLFMEIGFNCNK